MNCLKPVRPYFIFVLDEHLSQIINFVQIIFPKIFAVNRATVSLTSRRVSSLDTVRRRTCRKQCLCPGSFVTSQCIFILGFSLSGCILLNDSQKAENYFDTNWFSRMNTCSTREYIPFATAQLLSSWRRQRLSNKGDVHSSVTRKIGSVYYTVVEQLLI